MSSFVFFFISITRFEAKFCDVITNKREIFRRENFEKLFDKLDRTCLVNIILDGVFILALNRGILGILWAAPIADVIAMAVAIALTIVYFAKLKAPAAEQKQQEPQQEQEPEQEKEQEPQLDAQPQE